jgi:hypothetical protein
MTKTKSLLNYLFYNAIFGTCIYFGAVQGISGFMNVAAFMIWFVFIVFALSFLNEEAQIKMYESNNKRFKLGIVGHLITAGYIGVLVFYGHILLAALYLISVVLSYGMVEQGKKLVEGS